MVNKTTGSKNNFHCVLLYKIFPCRLLLPLVKGLKQCPQKTNQHKPKPEIIIKKCLNIFKRGMSIKIFLNTISAEDRSHKIIASSGIEISMPIITFGRILLLLSLPLLSVILDNTKNGL